MAVLVDTSVLIDHLRGEERARKLLVEAFSVGKQVSGSVLTRIEILTGLHPGEEEATSALLDLVDWVPVDRTVAEQAGRYARLHTDAAALHPIDLVVAATSQTMGATLWTRNVERYPMFPGLRTPY